MNLNLLLSWWNLVYVVPFGLALLYLGLYVFTGVTFGEAHDVDVNADVHVEADMDADADGDFDGPHGDVDGDGDVDADDGELLSTAHSGAALVHDAHAEHDSEAGGGHDSFVWSVLSLLGAGKIPLSLALMILLILWGSMGFVINQMLTSVMGATWLVGVVSLPITAVASLAGTGALARLLGKVMPTNETFVSKQSALVGCVGEALYVIDEGFGMATVRDRRGDLFQVTCRTGAGKPPIPKGTKVVLFDFNEEQKVFYAATFVTAQAV